MILHGIFAPMCVLLPILNVFGAMPRESGDATGIAVLVFWCLYFAPVGVLSLIHFLRVPIIAVTPGAPAGRRG